MPDATARLTELEIALTHQERLSEELSEVVRGQAERIARLEALVAALAARLEGPAADDGPAPPADVPPPHW